MGYLFGLLRLNRPSRRIESAIVQFPRLVRWLFAGVSVGLNDSPLYSRESRAAARRLVEQRQRECERMELILCYDRKEISEARASKWTEDAKERRMTRMISAARAVAVAKIRRDYCISQRAQGHAAQRA